MIDHFRANIFATLILLMHLGAAVESLLRGDPLRVMYFSGGAVLTLSVILMTR